MLMSTDAQREVVQGICGLATLKAQSAAVNTVNTPV